MRTNLALGLALLSAAGCGGPLVGADVEVPRICVTVHGQTVPAAPVGLGQQTVSWDGQIDLSEVLADFSKKGATTGEVRTLEVSMTSTTDMSMLSSAALDVLEPDPADSTGHAMRTLQHASYTRPQLVADPNRVDFVVEQPPGNLLGVMLANGNVIQYHARFTGTPPTTPWSTDVMACVYTHVTVDLTKI